MYEEVQVEQRKIYEQQLAKFTPNTFDQQNSRNTKTFTSYRNPIKVLDNKILVVKGGFGDINQFVLIDENKNEKTLKKLGIVNNPGFLSANDTVVVWTEYEF